MKSEKERKREREREREREKKKDRSIRDLRRDSVAGGERLFVGIVVACAAHHGEGQLHYLKFKINKSPHTSRHS